uniref:Uncharacterized protein n=1 Tax=viral metagenome TaxID=1070528 RepID=A0A6C0AHN5_9ZZZZ
MDFATEYDVFVEMNGTWPDLQAKLTGPDADRVGGCLQAYISAHYEKVNTKESFEKLNAEDNNIDRAYQEMRRTRIHEAVLFDELRTLVA